MIGSHVYKSPFEHLMQGLGGERINRMRTSASYRVFTQFGVWQASLDPDGNDHCWIFTRFDEPARVPLSSASMNKHSGKWNHTADFLGGALDLTPFAARCEMLGLQAVTGDALAQEKAAFDAREEESSARWRAAA